MFFKLATQRQHINRALLNKDGLVEAIQWFPNRSMPSWCAYCLDAMALPGRLLVLSPDGEAIARPGDVLVLSNDGRILVVPENAFFGLYEAA